MSARGGLLAGITPSADRKGCADMKLTNNLNLPQPIVDAVAKDEYDRGNAHISVTGLLRPPRVAALEEAHADELSEDASDRIWSLVGQVIHGVLERADKTGVTERRFSIEVEGWTVSGQADRFLRGLIQDYKFVTAWKFKDAGVPLEFEQQLNCYAEIHRQNGHDIKKLEIVGILRDWSKLEARRDPLYPQQQVVVRQVPLWSQAKAQAFIRERVILHQQARVRLPECSSEDRWARPDIYAVMKPGRKTAVRLYPTREAAQAHVASDPCLYIVCRPGENVRCANYCAVSKFCSQYKRMAENAEPALATEEAT